MQAGAQLWGQLRTEEADLNPRKALYDAIKAQVMVLATPLDQSAWVCADVVMVPALAILEIFFWPPLRTVRQVCAPTDV